MRTVLLLITAAALAGPALAAPGLWKRSSLQVEKPKPPKPGQSCTFSHDAGESGLSFTQTCTSPDRKTTSTHRCHFSWRVTGGLTSLAPAQELTFTGTARHSGTTGSCAAYINLTGVSAFYIEVTKGAGATKTGKLKVPGELRNPRTGKLNPLPLVFHLTGGNETRFVTQTVWYQWSGS
jgi:hypothetical protein